MHLRGPPRRTAHRVYRLTQQGLHERAAGRSMQAWPADDAALAGPLRRVPGRNVLLVIAIALGAGARLRELPHAPLRGGRSVACLAQLVWTRRSCDRDPPHRRVAAVRGVANAGPAPEVQEAGHGRGSLTPARHRRIPLRRAVCNRRWRRSPDRRPAAPLRLSSRLFLSASGGPRAATRYRGRDRDPGRPQRCDCAWPACCRAQESCRIAAA